MLNTYCCSCQINNGLTSLAEVMPSSAQPDTSESILLTKIKMKQQGLSDKSGNYPRTGKRGVPQQFPRKLFEMLDLESNNFKSGCVSWSNGGRAFRIADVDVFSEEILPVYFKTSKFSSFQRNLHLVSLRKHSRGSPCILLK